MTSMFDLPSWSSSELSDRQRMQYTTEPVGESLNSTRKTFRVTCDLCGQKLHSSTNNPSHYIQIHDEICVMKETKMYVEEIMNVQTTNQIIVNDRTPTELLDEKRANLVEQIVEAMKEREINSLDVNGTELCIRERQTSVGYYQVVTFGDSGDLESSIKADHWYYAHGDFNHAVTHPTRNDVIELIDAWDDIVKAFADVDAETKAKLARECQLIAKVGQSGE